MGSTEQSATGNVLRDVQVVTPDCTIKGAEENRFDYRNDDIKERVDAKALDFDISSSSDHRKKNPIVSENELIKEIEALAKELEDMMSIPSLEKSDSGGTYQTATSSSLIGLLRKIQHHVVSFQNEFPALKQSPVVMLDAGAGMHIPGVLFAILGRFNSIGIEIDKNRCALAAHFLSRLMEKYPYINISLWNRNIAVPGNWSKVTVFFVWDRVSGDFLNVCCIFRLLQGSIEVSFGLMSI